MLRSQATLSGRVRARKITLSEEGMEKLRKLREAIPEGRKSEEYCRIRNAILAQHGKVTAETDWHNVVTSQGDQLVADQLANAPARTKVDNANGHIQIGTGWTGIATKANTGCNTPVGTREPMDATYPKLKGPFGTIDGSVAQYRATFEAGDVTGTGFDEAAVHNALTAGDNLAYGQLTPPFDLGPTDTAQIDWEITALGS